MVHIVAITGSLRKASTNTGALRYLAKKLPAGVTMDIIVPDLPLFNQDIEGPDALPTSVKEFRERVKQADGFLFGCCEYNYSMSGVMKNAIDWASRGPDGNLFNNKPGGCIGAGGMGGVRAQRHLRDSALFLNIHMMNQPQVYFRLFDESNPFSWETGDFNESNAKSAEVLNGFFTEYLKWVDRMKVSK